MRRFLSFLVLAVSVILLAKLLAAVFVLVTLVAGLTVGAGVTVLLLVLCLWTGGAVVSRRKIRNQGRCTQQ